MEPVNIYFYLFLYLYIYKKYENLNIYFLYMFHKYENLNIYFYICSKGILSIITDPKLFCLTSLLSSLGAAASLRVHQGLCPILLSFMYTRTYWVCSLGFIWSLTLIAVSVYFYQVAQMRRLILISAVWFNPGWNCCS